MKKYIATTKNLSLLLLLSTTTTTTLAQDTSGECFSLQNSTTCSAFSQFYISLVGNVNRYPFLANVTDVASFDLQLVNYINSDSFYLQQIGCSSSSSQPYPYARYSLTYMCETLIQDSASSLPCNYQNNLNPPPLCQSTCFNWTNSIYSNTYNNLHLCPNQATTLDQITSLNTTCQAWSGLNATTNCISGLANEPNYCGLNGIKEACGYCSSDGISDSCCQLVSGCRSINTGAIIGIVIGCLIFLAIMGACIFFWFCKRRKTRKGGGVSFINGNGGNGYILKQKVEHNDSSSQLVGLGGGGTFGALGALSSGYESLKQPQQQDQFINSTISMHDYHDHHHTTTPLMVNTQQQEQQQEQTLEEFYQVKHPYPPQMGDELGLHVGDIVCVAMNFDDGWALGFNVTTGLKGVFPIVCVVPVPDELLEQLLLLVNNEDQQQQQQQQQQPVEEEATNKTLVEDNISMIVENLRRSISLTSKRSSSIINANNSLPVSELTQHNQIPKRTASMMRRYDYKESDSPTSPTHHTPFFPVPEPALFHQHLHNNINNNNTITTTAMSAVPKSKIETIEMYRKDNRISKLKESDD